MPIKKDNTKEFLSGVNKEVNAGIVKATLLVERSAKELCPVETGTLRRSITHEIQGNYAIVGTNVEYAPHVELGTVNWPGGKPFLRPALEANLKEIRRLLKAK